MKLSRSNILTAGLICVSGVTAVPRAVRADDAVVPPPEVKFYGHAEGGFVWNAQDPADRLNFGHLFTDQANDVHLNQVMAAFEKPLDAKADLDFGFKAQALFGTDARYTHFTGEFDRTIKNSRYQLDIVEVYASMHTAALGGGGTELKVGQFVTLLGAETIDPNTNFFYTHSYLFDFGLPLKHTGALVTTHVNDTFDVYLGVNSGVNTSLGKGDTNGAISYQAGLGINGAFGGMTNILLATQIGPELPRGTPKANTAIRQYWDLLFTTKLSDAFTAITEFNYIHEQTPKAVLGGVHPTGYGFDQYFVYTLSPEFTLALRGEVWRDEDGYWAAAFPGPLDFVNFERGFPATAIGGGGTTYGGVTLGLNFKPAVAVGPIDAVTVRPELRYDSSLNDTKPYNGGKSKGQFTAAVDLIVHF